LIEADQPFALPDNSIAPGDENQAATTHPRTMIRNQRGSTTSP
jgi:hypothetical protein